MKNQANNLLENNFSKSIAWRVDFNDIFEKYIQYLFEQVSKELGGEFYSNYKIRATSNKKNVKGLIFKEINKIEKYCTEKMHIYNGG